MAEKYFEFSDVEDTNITELDLSGQPIISFDGISKLKNLQKLNIQNSLITSFKGAVYLPQLQEIDFRNTILDRYPFSREMCLFAFNINLKKINGSDVTNEKNICENHPSKRSIEKIVRRGSFIVLNPQGNFFEAASLFSHEASLRIENYNNNSIKPKLSSDEIIKNLYQSASELRKIRIENHDKSRCFKMQIPRKYDENTAEPLQKELNSLKPPIEYLRDQIRFEAQNKKDMDAICSLQSQISENKQKLQRGETSLENMSNSITRLQEELKKLYKDQDQVLIEQLNTYCSKLNEFRDENISYNRLISEKEILTSKLVKYKETVLTDRSFESDLNKIVEAAEKLKNEKEKVDLKLNALNSDIKAQAEEIEKLSLEEQEKNQQNIQLQKEIEEKLREKADIEQALNEAIIHEKEETKKLAIEFEKKSQEISESVNIQNEPTIDDLTKIPPV